MKEQVAVTAETSSDARVTRQRYFQLYNSLSGMSGTVAGVEKELKTFYEIETVVIPTNRPCIRKVMPLRCFVDHASRNRAIVQEAIQQHRLGRPVLVGAKTIRHSLELSALLEAESIQHTVLNGLQDEAEANVVADAGVSGTVTIATNMAGRGTDIRLDATSIAAGGLHVIGAEPNSSRRVDRQLAGRAARQGDPGSCRFMAAISDDVFAGDEAIKSFANSSPVVDAEIKADANAILRKLQANREAKDFQTRQQMVSRDHWLDDILRTLAGRK